MNFLVVFPVNVFSIVTVILLLAKGHEALPGQILTDLKVNDSARNVTIDVRKCCAFDTLFKPYLDVCSKEKLPSNQTVHFYQGSVTIRFSEDSGLFQCPEGSVGAVAEKFHFLANGSVILPVDGVASLEPLEYCVEESSFKSFESSPRNRSNKLLVRFCSPDPCFNNGKTCIKKCCPTGMILDQSSETCAYADGVPKDILAVVQDENGSLVASSNGFNETFVVVRGHGLKCNSSQVHLGAQELIKITSNGSYINPQAILEVDKLAEQYCIDYTRYETDWSSGYRAMTCMKEVPRQTETIELAVQVYPYLELLSGIFLFFTLVVYVLLPDLRKRNGILIMCFISVLMLKYFSLFTLQIWGDIMPDAPCIMNAVVIHFCGLSAFAWLNVVSLDIWKTFSSFKTRGVGSQGKDNKFLYYSLYGWGIPGVIVLVGQILDNIKDLPDSVIRPQFGTFVCWFYFHPDSDPFKAPILYFYHGPTLLAVMANTVFYSVTTFSIFSDVCSIYRAERKAREKDEKETGRKSKSLMSKPMQSLRVTVTLFILMGIPFVTEIISFYTQSSFKASVVTDLINVLNGVFIFIMFVCKDSVIKMLKKRFAEIVGPLKPVSLTSVKTAITRLSASQHSWEPNESQGSISNERALKQTQQCQIMSVKILDDCE